MTTNRSPDLQLFVDRALAALVAQAPAGAAQDSLARIAEASRQVAPARASSGHRQPVCDHLGPVLDGLMSRPDLAPVAQAFRDLAPQLDWRPRTTNDTASANFLSSHANAVFLGPGGIEHRNDIWIGASLMAPHVRYPDHDHAPEETYLVLSDGEFWQAGGDWFTPGVGGSFYNVPGILHAMRSGDTPLLALWALWNPRAEIE